MGRTRHSAPLIGAAAIAVAAAGLAVVLVRGEQPLARASTTLRDVHLASVTHLSGVTVAASDGMRLLPGDVVHTAATGHADLVTRSRVARLGPSAGLAVISGASQQLRTGTVVIDAQHGPGVMLSVAADQVRVLSGSATEADRGVMTRVGALAGLARVTGPAGQQLSVPALRQVVTAGDALPTSTTPLQLLDDAAEAATVPNLVGDDETMKTLAAGIDRTGAAPAAAVLSSWHGAVAAMPDTARSERVLPVVIADATSGGASEQRYDDAVHSRADGGSWGVIVDALGGRASNVLAAFDSASTSLPSGGGAVQVSAIRGAGAAVRPTSHGRSVTRTGPSHRRTVPPRPVHKSHPISKKPSPSTPPVSSLVTTVKKVIGGVLSLVPAPTPGPGLPLGHG